MAVKPLLTLPKELQILLDPYLPSRSPSLSHFHLTLTYAQSLDAQISLSPGVQTALSGDETKSMTHYLRSRHDSILVGVGTAEADDPSLNCRWSEDGMTAISWDRHPIPIVLDPNGRWKCSESCNLLRIARNGLGKSPAWVIRESIFPHVDKSKVEALKKVGGTIVVVGENFVWESILKCIKDTLPISSVMVEGGGKVIESLLKVDSQSCVQSAIVTIAPVWLGRGGVSACPERPIEAQNQSVGRLRDLTWIQMGQDVVMAGRCH